MTNPANGEAISAPEAMREPKANAVSVRPQAGVWNGASEAVQVALWRWKHRMKSGMARLATIRPGLGAVARDVLDLRIGRATEWAGMGDGELKFGIDCPGEWMLPRSATTISGWCFSSAGPVSGVRAIVNGEVHEGFYGGEHAEIKDKLNGELPTANVGFAIQCSVQWGYNQIVLEVLRDDQWVPMCRSMRRAAYFPLVGPQLWNRYRTYVHNEQRRLKEVWDDYVTDAAALANQPLISLVMPVYKSDIELLEKAVESIRRQIYGRWELCIVDDGSGDAKLAKYLSELASDPRMRIRVRPENGNISSATNDGIGMAKGQWIAFVDHDDELSADALFHVASTINRKPDCDVIYTDQDKIDSAGSRCEPFFKPDWSPVYFRGVMYLGHLMVVRRALLEEVGGCDSRFDVVHDFELGLRLSERTNRIEHIPRVLYHWRAIAGSVAANGSAKTGIELLQERAVQAHLDRIGVSGRARRSGYGHRVNVLPAQRKNYPKISVLIPTRDHLELIGRCLQTLFGITKYPNFEVVVGDNETRDSAAAKILESYPIRKFSLAGAFHFARFINALAEQAEGEYLMLLNNDTEIVQADWLEHLLLHAEEKDAGAVGALLTYADDTVQHAGVIWGPRGTADHVMRGFPADCDGYMGSLPCSREVTAVTAAAAMVSREKFCAVGGFCERYQRHYDDLDFCLRLRRRGLRNIYVATARIVHHESRSRGNAYDFTDRILLLDRWEGQMERGDEYYNPNFERNSTDYRVGTGGNLR